MNIIRERKQALALQLFGKENAQSVGSFEARVELAQSSVAERDRLVGDLLLLTDLYYEDYKESMYALTSGTDFFSNAAITGMNAVSTLTGGAEFKSLIAAITTGVSGVKSEFDRSILRDKTLLAIFKQMDASRAEMNRKIQISLKNTRTGNLAEYPITEALRDIVAYYNAGTLVGALTAIEASASIKETEAKNDMNKQILKIQEL